MEKKLKIALCILVILLISIISFIGVYSKNIASYKNNLPEYLLSSELTGKRISTFKASEDTEEKIYDKDGNEVKEIPEGANEEEYKKENAKINADEKLTIDNYKLVKEIFTGRLDELGVSEYTVRLNETSGEVVVELPENMDTDTILQYLLCKGDFSMTDAEDRNFIIRKIRYKRIFCCLPNIRNRSYCSIS